MPARQLPDRPDLEQYKKQAKDLLKAWNARDHDAVARFSEHHPHLRDSVDAEGPRTSMSLADAQLVLAREHGFENWPRFAQQIAQTAPARRADEILRKVRQAIVDADVETLESLIRDHRGALHGRSAREGWEAHYSPGDARAIIAREHFFERWEAFAAFHEASRNPQSPVAWFEQAVDAIVSGDVPTLERALHAHPSLINSRSLRTHRSTLLHYVGANGVEDFRQRTPKDVVKVAEVLLDAGADINAVADMYGGADTLGLVATSIHPIQAGVQQDLMELLLNRGASASTATGGAGASGQGKIVNACLANGRPGTAEFMAARGAPVDLEAAAGLGRLDLVTPFFAGDGSLIAGATAQQMHDGFSWACEYGRSDVVDFMLQNGMNVAAKLRPHGQTGLHWAAHGGHVATVRMLLHHHAPVDVKDERFNSEPLAWALHAWGGNQEHLPNDRYYDVVETLIDAGARVNPQLLREDDNAWPEARRIRDDARMRTLLIRA